MEERRGMPWRGDVLMRMQRRLGLAPEGGMGTARRAAFWGLLGWAPVAAWALATGHGSASETESLLTHYGVTVRLLIAVPLMVVAEGVAAATVLRLATHCAVAGLFHGDPAALRRLAVELAELRDRVHPWAVAIGVTLAWVLAWRETGGAGRAHDLAWAGGDAESGFGPLWYVWVARPIFIAFVAAWLWRAMVLAVALHRLAAGRLNVVPSHPDRAGGLGFAEPLATAFGVVAFALSAVIAAGWAHDVAVHGANIEALRAQMIAAVVVISAIFLSPFAALVPLMVRTKADARLQYGALVARYGDALHRRWIVGETLTDPLLDAPEVGASADAATLYEAVMRMRPLPIGPGALLVVVVPATLPMIVLAAMQIPVIEMLKTLAGAMV